MIKQWVYRRKGIKGWWVGWYESGKRKAKAFPTKSLAEHFRHIKYTQLNSDVFTSVVDFDWRQMVEEYRQFKRGEGRKDASIYEVLLTLRHFKRLVGCNSSKEVTQPNLDAFVLERGDPVSEGQEVWAQSGLVGESGSVTWRMARSLPNLRFRRPAENADGDSPAATRQFPFYPGGILDSRRTDAKMAV